MLDTDTKRRIDTARDILVGKVPDPKSQVEQITIALIYKFMDDMDAESEEFGGKRKFFAGNYARYGWAKLMRSGLGGHETLNLYAEAITKMSENPGIPRLFLNIFKNAYLPYRDPETLKMFLKVIDEFNYDHSEHLGDAFEYLLSVLGSQGDAGQFRTPRHIIDFMVEIIDPKKNETVLDPACGTAGFLISSYKHILKANADSKGNSTLTPDDRGCLAKNFNGYDISPDMVRLSLVNLYLHGFADPHISEYDTLTSQEKWNEYADVILANPPFMSPKGGIKPHNRFSVQSKRSEVLFVDYMAEHLTPNGRAGIIVPEGVIFQSQTAYKQLRKMLVDEFLVAVISLPAGVFNPYSGVKTSILILDKTLAKKSNSILFIRINNEGTDLGARRRSIEDSDLPEAVSLYKRWAECLRGNDYSQQKGLDGDTSFTAYKTRIAADGEYNLTAERYRDMGLEIHRDYPMTRIGDHVAESSMRTKDGDLPVWSVSNHLGFVCTEEYFNKQVASEDISNYKVVAPFYFAYNPSRINVGSVALNLKNEYGAVSPMYVVFSTSSESIDAKYLFSMIKSERLSLEINRVAQGAIRSQLRFKELANLRIPLPPLDIQKQIVAEIEGYQKVIDGARAVLDNYRPHISIDPTWQIVELNELIDELESGVSVNSMNRPTSKGELGILKTSCVTSGVFDPEEHKSVLPEEHARIRCPVRGNTIIISRMNTEALVGASAFVPKDYPYLFLPDRLWQAVISRTDLEVRYLQAVLASPCCRERISTLCCGTSGSMKNISKPQLLSLKIPFPPLSIQRAIVAENETEHTLVDGNRKLIARMENKIQATLARVWGDT